MGRLRQPETMDLPPGMQARRRASGTYYYLSRRVGPKREEIPLGKLLEQALLEYAAQHPQRAQPLVDVPAAARDLLRRARKGAKQRGLEFRLELAEIEQLLARCDGRCSITGIPFDLRKPEGARKRLWAPSLDRISSGGGYVPGNVRIVAVGVNIAMSDFGEEFLLRIAHALLRQRRIQG